MRSRQFFGQTFSEFDMVLEPIARLSSPPISVALSAYIGGSPILAASVEGGC